MGAHYSWGVALFKHGDLGAADAKLMDTNQRGPHWADPLKSWGDVLVKQGMGAGPVRIGRQTGQDPS
jgi:hypothetical protein